MNTPFSQLFDKFRKRIDMFNIINNKFMERGFDALNDYFPKFDSINDVYSERIKNLLLMVCSISIILMIVSQHGWLYACLPRPFTAIFLMINNIDVGPFPTPEYGIHLLTVFIYLLSAYIGMVYMENQGIDKPFHKIAYVFALTLLTFYTPFEWIYITLLDVFHNIPIYGYPAVWMFGWKNISVKSFSSFFVKTVIGVDGIITVSSLLIMYIIKRDLNKYIKTEFRINKISLTLFSLFLFIMFLWVISPLYMNVVGYGTNYFPQTIYVQYGYFDDFGLPIPRNGDIYGIVKEFWYKNDAIKILNHSSKLFSVVFMFYTFIPRKKINGNKNNKGLKLM